MNLPQRKRLPHDVPLFIDPSQEVYFITVCCDERGRNQLAVEELAAGLFESIEHRNIQHIWYAYLFVVMPDHVHALLSFPPYRDSIKQTVRLWKHWTAAKFGIKWQKDFFEHRLRQEESRREKADYILNNPVRAGLVKEPREWPYVWWPDGGAKLVSWKT